LEEVGESGLLLGVRESEAYDESEFRFEAGDRLLVYTDGLTEAENTSGMSFGEAALSAFIRDNRNVGTEQFADRLLREAIAWSRNGWGTGQKDDITFVVIDLKGGAEDDDVTNVRQVSAA
jgi:sigma-B regulation protein RsbU (phosphoserine phosphatase)